MTTRTVHQRALLLRALDRGDDDRWLSFLTPDQGRVHAIARHARGSSRRFAGALQPFVLIEAALRQRPGGLFFLEEARAVEFPLGTEPGLEALGAGWLFLELAEQFCSQGQEQAAFFELVLGALRRSGKGAEDLGALRLSVLWSALELEGWAPDLERCHRCGRELAAEASLQPQLGGLLCGDCLPRAKGALGPEGLAALRHAAAGRVQGPPPPAAEAALLDWAEQQIGRPLRSARMDFSLKVGP